MLAFSVAHTAIKTVYDHEDGMVAAPHDVTAINEVITKKFQVSLQGSFFHKSMI